MLIQKLEYIKQWLQDGIRQLSEKVVVSGIFRYIYEIHVWKHINIIINSLSFGRIFHFSDPSGYGYRNWF